MTGTDKLKPLPYSTSKNQLTKWYISCGVSEKNIRHAINAIISDNRKLPPGKTIYDKNVRHDELQEFVEQFGLPKDYYNPYSKKEAI
ncbi:hypothetical protein GR160_02965 [Flavobacterium sp. Sd200]|uniref:hypothetical protein n=1 Tax=Flavobacterium sp. Sd200 TaxID=2692211 RepID=UPI001369AB88|nr:hypothetical protein [Flavobacterium sp. Sd200]MXN90175.1 hypothetical protein [Flavobacterium sp. Sd200]